MFALCAAGLDRKFDDIQLIPAANGYDSYSAQKDTCHLPNIKAATRCDYADMLFLDDEQGNVNKVGTLPGVLHWCLLLGGACVCMCACPPMAPAARSLQKQGSSCVH